MMAFEGDLGAGLKFETDAFISPEEVKAFDLKGGTTESFLPDQLTFYSARDDLSLADFEGAVILAMLVGGPKVQAHRHAVNVNFESTLFQLHIPGKQVLLSAVRNKSGVIDASIPAAPTIAATDKRGKDIVIKEAEKWWKFKIGVRLVELTIGAIYLAPLPGSGPTRPLIWRPKPIPKIASLAPGSFRVLFERDSPYLTSGFGVEQDARLRLELQLAESRALLFGGSRIGVEGMASPEATVAHNARLSYARAEHVRQAIIDAFGVSGSSLVFEPPVGSGEARARTEGHLDDPPEDPVDREAWLAGPNGSQAADWPKWRVVQVTLDRAALVRAW